MAVAKDGMFANLGPALLRLRKLRGKSQAEVAQDALTGKSQLSKYETGKELPKLDSLERVLAVLDVGHVEFFYSLFLLDRGKDQGPAAPYVSPAPPHGRRCGEPTGKGSFRGRHRDLRTAHEPSSRPAPADRPGDEPAGRDTRGEGMR